LARRLSNSANIGGGEAGEAGRAVKADADRIIARDEKTPWQEHDSLDRVLLVLLLLAVALPLIAAALRAAGRRPKPPWTASMFAALAAVAAALLVAYRIVNEPGNDAVTTVKTGAPLGLLMLALIGLGSAPRSDARSNGRNSANAHPPEGAQPQPLRRLRASRPARR
jgi:4-amino-4-deoxy-L-arabinose transferase-like glycosyltransferase